MKRLHWLVVAFFIFFTTSCTHRTHTPSVVPAWKRAGQIGFSSRANLVSMVIAADDAMVIVGYPARSESEKDYIHLSIIRMDGVVRYDADLQPSVPDLDQLKLVGDAGDGLHLLWTTGSINARVLWSATLPSIPEKNEEVTIQPLQISQSETSVVWFESYHTGTEGQVILWLDDSGQAFGQLGIGDRTANSLTFSSTCFRKRSSGSLYCCLKSFSSAASSDSLGEGSIFSRIS